MLYTKWDFGIKIAFSSNTTLTSICILGSIISAISVSSRIFFMECMLYKLETSIFSDFRYFMARAAPSVFIYALFFILFLENTFAAAFASCLSLSSI